MRIVEFSWFKLITDLSQTTIENLKELDDCFFLVWSSVVCIHILASGSRTQDFRSRVLNF